MSESTPTQIYYETREFCHRDAYKHLSNLRRALIELKQKTNKVLKENNIFWKQEVERARLERDKEWLMMYQSLAAENKKLRIELENLLVSDTEDTCTQCYKDVPSWEAEQRIDDLSRKLGEKQILISKLQITLAEQSKIMFELEKSNFMLHLRYKSAIQKKSKLFNELMKTDNSKFICQN